MLRRDGRWPTEPIETIYFGGGTPSLLDPDALRTLLLDVVSSTPSFDAVEVTVEANPEDVSESRAASWAAMGVNRVSLGAQSFDEQVLRWMHRSHDGARIDVAVRTLRTAGIGNISLDLIFALPESLERDWGRDLDRAFALEPDHVSLYGLTVEERTPLARWITRGATVAPDDDRYAAEYLLAQRRLVDEGFEVYEVSNAARPGRRSHHNSAYWSGRPYVGVGPAAHSFDGRTRRWNVAAWEAYRRTVRSGESPTAKEEVLTAEQRRLESLFLGLRTQDGVAQGLIDPRQVETWERQGWIEVREAQVRCTAEGWLRLDALVRSLETGRGLTGGQGIGQIITAKGVE